MKTIILIDIYVIELGFIDERFAEIVCKKFEI